MPEFDTPHPIDLDIAVAMGNVELDATDSTTTTVEVLPHNPHRAGDVSLARETIVRFDAGRLTIVVPKRLNLFGPGDSVDVLVAVPSGTTATVTVGYGDIRTRGVLGASSITASYGSTNIDRTGDLKLKSPHGDVDVQTVDGDLDLTSGYGRLRIGQVTGGATIKGSHGPLEFGEVCGTIDARTSGPVTVDHAGGNSDIRTAYGPIRIGEVFGGTARLENGYARIEVGVPTGTAAWIDAASKNGVVRNELTAESGPGDAERTVELRLRANYGDVVIHRAVSARR